MNVFLHESSLSHTHILYIYTHIHRPYRWPTMITKGIMRNMWMLWGTFDCKYWTNEQWGNEQWGKRACFSDQEYHLNHNNLQDEVASGWRTDRKVRSPRQAGGEMGRRSLIKEKKTKNNWSTYNTTASGARAKTECSLCFSKLKLQSVWDERLNSAKDANLTVQELRTAEKGMSEIFTMIFNYVVNACWSLTFYKILFH